MILSSLGVLAAALLAFDGFLYLSFSSRLNGDLRRQLTERAQLAQTLAASLAPQQLADRLANGGITARVIKDGRSYLAQPPGPIPPIGGRPLSSPLAKRPPRAHPANAAPISVGGRPRTPGPPAPLSGSSSSWGSTISEPLPGGERLVLSADRSQLDHDLAGLLLLEAAGSAVVLVVAALALARVLGRALLPLDRTTAVASAITRGEARERLRPQRVDTELGRLAQAFDAMLDRLEAALDAARGSEERMRQFLGDAAHELRTPVQAIQSSAETMLRESQNGPQHERLAIQMIRDSVRAGRLVDDLLTLNHFDHGIELQPVELDLVELCREQLARAEVLAPGLELRYEGPIRCPVRADRDRLAQVLVNLLDNARHATPDGGSVTVSIAREDDGGVSLAVSDSGPGVPAEDRERIFERFVRLDPSRARGAFGSGLGLAIARQIAQAHGGALRCTEPKGAAGARFELALPSRSREPVASRE